MHVSLEITNVFYYMRGLDEINFRASVQVHFYSVLHVL